MVEEIFTLAEQLKSALPATNTEVHTFPSGAVMLDVRHSGRLFVLAYTPAGGFGVDEVREEEGFEMGYRFLSKDFREAAEELHRLLREAHLQSSAS
jgi:hypothetical protein